MKTRLTPVGKGASLVLDETMLESLGVDPNAEVEVSTNGHEFVVTPIRDAELDKRFRESAEKITAKHAGLFKRLSQ